MFGENIRRETVQKQFPHATVVLGDIVDKYKVICDYQPDILAFGYDQRVNEEELSKLFPRIQTVRITDHKSDIYKSSLLKAQLVNQK